MEPEQRATLLYDLDVCQSLFATLANSLEHNVTGDYHALAVLAQEGKRKIDGIADQMDRSCMAA